MTILIEAGPTIAELVDRVLAGEDITLTRDGRPAVQLVPAEPRRRFDAAWFRANRIKPSQPFSAVVAVRQMRDDGC